MSRRKMMVVLSCAVAVVVGSSSCTKKSATSEKDTQVGIASWYGHPFHGRPTASGEIYDMEKLTAAHQTLPLGTVVHVDNLVNNKMVEVRINDRGPFVGNRIIDLSHAAAQNISMPGIANVRLTVISRPPTRGVEEFAVQVGAFANRPDADRLREQMAQKYGTARLVFRDGDQTWRVLVGLEPTMESANALADQLTKEGGPAFVVLVDSE
jgi:rare lipoprotein A